jgi:hypothetical protein
MYQQLAVTAEDIAEVIAFACRRWGSAGRPTLRLTCVNSVAIVGARAAIGYGEHVAIGFWPKLPTPCLFI